MAAAAATTRSTLPTRPLHCVRFICVRLCFSRKDFDNMILKWRVFLCTCAFAFEFLFCFVFCLVLFCLFVFFFLLC